MQKSLYRLLIYVNHALREILASHMCLLLLFRENEILAKIAGFTVTLSIYNIYHKVLILLMLYTIDDSSEIMGPISYIIKVLISNASEK